MKKYLLILFLIFNIVFAENVGEFNFRSDFTINCTLGFIQNNHKIIANSLQINPFQATQSGSVGTFFNYPILYYGIFNLTKNQWIVTSSSATSTYTYSGNYYSCQPCGVCGYYNNFSKASGNYEFFNLNNQVIDAGDRLVFRLVNTQNQILDIWGIHNINNAIVFSGQVLSDFTITYPAENLNINQYNNTIKFIVNGLAGYNQFFKYDLTLTNKYGTILYSSSTPISTTTLTEGVEYTLNVSNHNLKQIIIDNLNYKGYNEFYIYLRLYLTNGSLNINFLGAKYFNLSNVFKPLGDYLSFYNDNIGAFGLSGATPTALFSRLGILIDNFLNINLFTAITPNINGKDLADSFNNFLAYVKALANFLPFQLILAFFSIIVLIGLIKKIFLR